MFIRTSVIYERKKGYVTLWVGVLFSLIVSGFGEKIYRWFGMLNLIKHPNFIKEASKLSFQERNFVQFISMTFTGVIVGIVILLFFFAIV